MAGGGGGAQGGGRRSRARLLGPGVQIGSGTGCRRQTASVIAEIDVRRAQSGPGLDAGVSPGT